MDEFDSLRGLAALSVVLHHFKVLWLSGGIFSSFRHQKLIVDFLLMPFTAGPEAVIFFFVLSGFVLSIPAVKSRAQSYAVFVTRRVFRIYVPYLAALTFAVLMVSFGDMRRCNCLGAFWFDPSNWNDLTQHLIFIGKFNTGRFDPPIWSLVHEMRISLLFPFLCLIVLRLSPARSLLMAACMSGLTMVAWAQMPPDDSMVPFLNTLHYAALFVLGICLARRFGYLSETFNRLSIQRKIALAIFSSLLFFYGSFVAKIVIYNSRGLGFENLADWPTALGAVGIIIVGRNSLRCRDVLLWRPIHLVGKMSYSIYLLHFIFMEGFVRLLSGKLPLPAIFAICFVSVIIASFGFHRFVELPSMSAGRKLSGYLRPSQ